MAEMKIHDPGNTQPITELYAYLSIDKNGNEGLCGAPIFGIETMPLVFGHAKTAALLKPVVMEIARKTGKIVQLVKFTTRETIETIT